MKKNLRKRALDERLDSEMMAELLADFDKLQVCSDTSIFDIACKLFSKKWIKKSPGIANYCRNELFNNETPNPMATWYEGYSFKTPSTNNALEAFNKVFKDLYTFRKRMKVSEFCGVLVTSIEAISQEKKRGENLFKSETSISLRLWTAAYQFKSMKKTLRILQKDNGFNVFVIPSGSELTICEKKFKLFMDRTWKTFKSFAVNSGEFYILKIDDDANVTNNLWSNGNCTCPAFAKNFMCKHLIGVSLRKNLMNKALMPAAAKNIPLGERRKPGRPALAKRALVNQDSQKGKVYKSKSTGRRKRGKK